MKIGLVTPYIFPLPGGVNAHVGYLYENLVKRGHDVRIISSTHGPQRSSEGDIIRLGYGWSVPTNGSIGTLTVSHRYGQLVAEMLDRERFDIIHFHEPFVPFLSLQILRHSKAVNVATFHAYSGFSPSYEFGQRMMKALRQTAPRAHRRERRGAPLHRPLLPGRVQGHPQRRGPARSSRACHPSRAGATASPTSSSSGASRTARGSCTCCAPTTSCAWRASAAGCWWWATDPQLGEVRRYIASRRLGGVELLGRLSEHDKARAFATADIYASPATGQESFGIVLLEAMAAGVPIVCSDIHGYKGVVRRNEQAVLVPPRDVEGLAAALGTLLRDPLLRQRMGESGRERAQQFSWEAVAAKVEDYYGFVVRRLASSGSLPPDFRAPVPEAPGRPLPTPGFWSGPTSIHEGPGLARLRRRSRCRLVPRFRSELRGPSAWRPAPHRRRRPRTPRRPRGSRRPPSRPRWQDPG